jgi:hypothetical protein
MKTLDERDERGNNLLLGNEGQNVVAILRNGEGRWTVVTYSPENYPSLTIREIEATEDEMAASIRRDYACYEVRKLNIRGVEIDGEGCIAETDEAATE